MPKYFDGFFKDMTTMFFSVALLLLSIVILIRSIRAFAKVYIVKKFLSNKFSRISSSENRNLYIIIPVLREQNIIADTLNYYLDMYQKSLENISFQMVIVGTIKEKFEKETNKKRLSDILRLCSIGVSKSRLKHEFLGVLTDKTIDHLLSYGTTITYDVISGTYISQSTSGDVVQHWIRQNSSRLKRLEKFNVIYIECPDENGNRTSQINYAYEYLKGHIRHIEQNDIIGIYDADSRPEMSIISNVFSCFTNDIRCGQQPLHYLDAANRLALENRSPIVVANALYQTTWTVIKEIPNFLSYAKHIEHQKNSNSYRQYPNSVYMFGHGEFLTVSLLDSIGGLPAKVSADGMQLGYRLSLINEPIRLFTAFCSDDVPSTVSSLITQHSRWYAGNIEYDVAYNWACQFLGIKLPKQSYIENIFLNINWALRPFVFLAIFALSHLYIESHEIKLLTDLFLITGLIIYCYLTPYLSIQLMPVPVKVRFLDWLFIPIAVLVKSIGPWKYLFSIASYKLFGFKIELKKVER